jgi:hypothetical protein
MLSSPVAGGISFQRDICIENRDKSGPKLKVPFNSKNQRSISFKSSAKYKEGKNILQDVAFRDINKNIQNTDMNKFKVNDLDCK